MGRNIPPVKVNNYASIFTNPIFKNQNGEWYREVGYEDSMGLIRENFLNMRKSFVAIGYYLKHLAKNELYKEGGYESIWECAQTEFGLSQTSTTRYMQMNDAYSQNGDTPILDEKYTEFNKSQLQEMLSLPEEVRKEIRPEQTVSEIRDIVREEKKRKEPSEEEIRRFYEIHVEKYINVKNVEDRENLKELLIRYFGKCHAGGSFFDSFYQCSPRGIQLGKAEEITWTQFVKRIDEYFPLNLNLMEEQKQIHEGNIPEQMQIRDYPEYLPVTEKQANKDAVIDGEYREQDIIEEQMEVIDSFDDESKVVIDGECREVDSAIAISQLRSPFGLTKSVYPPDSLVKSAGCGNKHTCFSCGQVGCRIREEQRYCTAAPLGNPFSCDTLQSIIRINNLDSLLVKEELTTRCQFINQNLAYHRRGDGEAVPCCKECEQQECKYRCNRSKDSHPEDEDNMPENVNQLSAVKDILEQENKLLKDYLEVGGLPERTVFRQKIIVEALTIMVYGLEKQEEE